MSRTISTYAIAALLAAAVLSGCSAKTQSKDMSLMERFNSGLPLIADSDPNLSSEQEQARAHLARGLQFAGQERKELAFEQFTRAANLDPQLTEARYRRALIMMDNGLNNQALAELSAVMEQSPEFAPAFEAAGMVYFNSALYAEAEAQLHKALALDPNLVGAQVHIGVIRNYAKDYAGALAAFHAALAVTPNDGSIYNNIGMTQSMLGDDVQAVEAFSTALRLGAPSTRTYNNMGLALARLKRWDEALEAFRCAGGEAAAYNNLGYLYFLDGMYPQAVQAFERAISLEPRFYVRANENLKRARLAMSFNDGMGPRAAHTSAPVAIPHLSEDGPVTPGPLVPATGAPGPALSPAAPTPGPALGLSLPRPRTTAPVLPSAAVPEESDLAAEPASAPAPMTIPQAAPAARMSPVSAIPASSVGGLSALATPVSFSPAAVAFSPSPLTMNRPAMAARTAHEQLDEEPSAMAGYDPGPMPEKPVYTLHVSSWRTMEHAVHHADQLKAMGLAPYILHVDLPGKGEWFRVTIGMFDSLDQARAELAARGHDGTFRELRIVRTQRHLHAQG